MSQFVAQGRGVSPSFGDMTSKLVSGDAVACFHGWAAMNTFAADQGVDDDQDEHPGRGQPQLLRLLRDPADDARTPTPRSHG